ncbi:MAG: alanine racemase [Oscillospiraceae bacterium]|nr:alanine racemase [Oscillospiraceae bacterium]
MDNRHFPALEVNLDAIRTNAKVLCDICNKNGISVAGVIKFSDCDLEVAKAYSEGGCAQIGVSRAKHLKKLREAYPNVETLLTRAPTRGDLADTARYADLTLVADFDILNALNDEAAEWGTKPGIILMLDVGDLREGVDNIPELVEMAKLCEALPHLNLRGVGTNHACLNGVLPSFENLSFLIEGAEAIENAIGRKLDIISGGSSINLLLLNDGVNKMPARINHLRLGGSIANPMNIRLVRGISFAGMREDSVRLTAEIVDIHEKASAPKNSTKNWAGQTVVREDKGRRLRAILAVGSQDIGDAMLLSPLDPGLEIVGCSSDHTIIDVTDSKKAYKSGDIITFQVRYGNMLYAFTGDHVSIEYYFDKKEK